MSKENSRERKLQYIFTQHPKAKEFHVTSDDQAFTSVSDANNHAKSLDDKTVDIANRADYVKIKAVDAPSGADENAEREALSAKHNKLFGKLPAKNAKLETIKEKIAAEEVRLAEEAKESGAGEGDGADEGKGE